MDDWFVGKTPRDKPLFWHLKPGSYSVQVLDDQGRADVTQMTDNVAPVAP